MVTSKQIKNNTITTADIKNGTITRADLSRSAVVAGPRGATGAVGVSGYEQRNVSKFVAADQYAVLSLTCPSGKKLLSASGFWTNWTTPVQVEYTSATTATAYVGGPAEDDTLVLVAVCAKVA